MQVSISSIYTSRNLSLLLSNFRLKDLEIEGNYPHLVGQGPMRMGNALMPTMTVGPNPQMDGGAQSTNINKGTGAQLLWGPKDRR